MAQEGGGQCEGQTGEGQVGWRGSALHCPLCREGEHHHRLDEEEERWLEVTGVQLHHVRGGRVAEGGGEKNRIWLRRFPKVHVF